ncbi:MAG TPA: ROK family protein, partial [Actinomycetota bacterium]|nr:ROK family protein [Actinomycetota bacterium]
MGNALAVDVGGTKLAAGIVDEEGCLLEQEETATPSTSDAEEVFARLLTIVGTLARAATVCGVGCGGPMTRGGEEVSPLNIPAWRGFPLRGRLQRATGLPTYVDND